MTNDNDSEGATYGDKDFWLVDLWLVPSRYRMILLLVRVVVVMHSYPEERVSQKTMHDLDSRTKVSLLFYYGSSDTGIVLEQCHWNLVNISSCMILLLRCLERFRTSAGY